MAFEKLLHQVMSEKEILQLMIKEVQQNFQAYQSLKAFVKLEKSGAEADRLSRVAWVREFTDIYDMGDFYYETVYQRACVMMKFHNGQYELIFKGFYFYYYAYIKALTSQVEYGYELDGTYETKKMISRELLYKGFSDIAGELNTAKRNKAV